MPHRALDSDDGAVIVEFGVVFPILALLILAVIAAGDVFSIRVALQHAAREGVREMALYREGQAVTVAQDAAPVPIQVTPGEVCDPEAQEQRTSLTVAHAWTGPAALRGLGVEIELETSAVMRCGG